MQTSAWAKNDALFISELKKGYEWQVKVGSFLQEQGLSVEIPALEIRDDIKDAGRFLTSVDLVVNGIGVEVKSRNVRFTSASNFPYPTVFVDTVSGFDAKEKLGAYIFVSQITGCMLALPAYKDRWMIEEKYDRVRNITDRFYLVNREELCDIDDLVKGFSNAS